MANPVKRAVKKVKSVVKATGRRLTEAPELRELARKVRKAKGPLGKRR